MLESNRDLETEKMIESCTSVTAVYTMVFALSGSCLINKVENTVLAHSIFEGLAIGLQDTSADLWVITGIVLVHKSILALVMGIAALRTLKGLRKPIVLMTMFSFASPVGIGIGTLVHEESFFKQFW